MKESEFLPVLVESLALIVLEGIDASGKKTQAQLLVQRLKKSGKKAVLIGFPSYDRPFGKMIARYLKGELGPRERVPRKFVCILYALDRYSRKKEIQGYLSEGFVVVLDRYTQANLAYQTAGLNASERKKLIAWIEWLEGSLPKADAVVFLDVPPLESQRLLGKRKNKIRGVRRDIHEKDRAFTRRVYENYKLLAREKKWVVVNCMRKGALKLKEEIAEGVFGALRERKAL